MKLKILRGDKTGKKTETDSAVTAVSKFDKQQLLKSQRYHERRDLLFAILKNDRQYSHAEVEALTSEFMNKGVN